MNDEPRTSSKKVVAGVLLLVVVLIVVGAIIISKPKSSSTITNTASTSKTASAPEASSSTPTYKDGTYTSTGTYNSPGGNESIKVTITLVSDAVTTSEVVAEADDPTASSYQSIFIDNYKTYVDGKKITSIKLSSVSGSSLTSEGFNSALQKIETQAKA